MSDNGAIREYSSSGVSTFLHHTEVGEAIKQITFERDTYLGVAKVYGLRNKEYLMENLQGLKVGDRVTLYRKYNSEASTSTAVQVSNVPDDGSSIRVHTLAGLCLGYIQPPERYVMAELMKAGKHLYAKIHELNVPDSLDALNTHNAVDLDVYWLEESNPLKIANTYELGMLKDKFEPMKSNSSAIWLMQSTLDRDSGVHWQLMEAVNTLKPGTKLKLVKKPGGDVGEIDVWTADKAYYLGHMEPWDTDMIAHMMEAGKCVYGEVKECVPGDSAVTTKLRFDVYVEDSL